MADEEHTREKMIERQGGTDAPWYRPLPKPQPRETHHDRDRQAEAERIHYDRARHEYGFPVAGHGEPTPENDPGRTR